jgi:hypothetical protein
MLSRKMKWIRHVANTRKREGRVIFLIGNLIGKDNFVDLRVDGSIMLKKDLSEIGFQDIKLIELARGRTH